MTYTKDDDDFTNTYYEQKRYAQRKKKPKLNFDEHTATVEEIPSLPLIHTNEKVYATSETPHNLWAMKYAPQVVKDLVIHNKKIDQVRDWLLNSNPNSLLVLVGPCGCGKTTVLKLLCQENDIDIVELSDPDIVSSYMPKNFTESNDEPKSQRLSYIEQSIKKSSKFSSLSFTDDMADENSLEYIHNDNLKMKCKNLKKVTILKDLPIYTKEYRKHFSQLMVSILSQDTNIMNDNKYAFILTEANGLNFTTYQELIPNTLLELPNVTKITFNSVAPMFMKKIALKILTSENLLDKGQIISCKKKILPKWCEDLMMQSNGDIRHFIHQLEFKCIGRTMDLFKKDCVSYSTTKVIGENTLFKFMGEIMFYKQTKRSFETLLNLFSMLGMESSLIFLYIYDSYLLYLPDSEDSDLIELSNLAESFSLSNYFSTFVPYYYASEIVDSMNLTLARYVQLRKQFCIPKCNTHDSEYLGITKKPEYFTMLKRIACAKESYEEILEHNHQRSLYNKRLHLGKFLLLNLLLFESLDNTFIAEIAPFLKKLNLNHL